MGRLGQREGADGGQLGHRRQPPLPLLLRAEHGDRLHGQPGLDAEEGAQAAVAAVELEVDQTVGDRAHRRAAVALDPVADDPEAAKLLDQVTGELGALPVVVDDRQHLVVDEVPGAVPVVALLRGELVGDPEEVGAAGTADAVKGVSNMVWPAPSVVEDVGAGCLGEHVQAGRPERCGRRTVPAAALVEPRAEVGPPGALLGVGALEPDLGV